MATLGRPDSLFAMPEGAGCVAGQVEIGFGALGGHLHDHGGEEEAGHDDHDHGKEAGHDDHDHGHEEDADEEEGHSEVVAYYRIVCEDMTALNRIDFRYFDAFPNAEELDVVVLSAAGQSAGEVEPGETVFTID